MKDLHERFEAFVYRSKDPNGCWLWLGYTDKDGYGSISILDSSQRCGVRTFKAHRLAWELETGNKPAKHVLHRCDVPGCVRPDHLFIGDNRINNRDMTLKGRNGFQHNNPSKKLTVAEVFGLRLGRLFGISLKELAAQYGVRESTISRIANGVRRGGHSWTR